MRKLIGLIFITVLLLAGCTLFEENKSEVVIGKWKLNSEMYEVYEFKKNGNVSLDSYKFNQKIYGTWVIENDTLYLRFNYLNSGVVARYNISFKGRNIMILTDGIETLEYRRL